MPTVIVVLDNLEDGKKRFDLQYWDSFVTEEEFDGM